MSRRILVIDDDPLVRGSLAAVLAADGLEVIEAEDAPDGLLRLAEKEPDLVLCDVRLPGMNGLEFLRVARERHPNVDVIVMTAFGSVENAVTAVKEGALDYLTKPIDDMLLRDRVRGALAGDEGPASADENDEDFTGRGGIIARHPSMQRVLAKIDAVAETRATVLIQGESGTGKTVLARTIHALSDRSDEAFVEVSCGSLPDPLLESELFGYEKGAFTGALKRMKPGKFEVAR